LDESVARDAGVIRERSRKRIAVFVQRLEPRHGRVKTKAHFVRMRDWQPHLGLQCRNPSIPEERFGPRQIPEFRRVPRLLHASDATRPATPVRVPAGRIVAGRASDTAIARKLLLEKETLTQRDLLCRWRVVGWKRRRANRPAEDVLQGRERNRV